MATERVCDVYRTPNPIACGISVYQGQDTKDRDAPEVFSWSGDLGDDAINRVIKHLKIALTPPKRRGPNKKTLIAAGKTVL